MTGVKRVPLGGSEASVPNVVLGLMRIADASDDEVRALVRAARDAGIDFFDHADIYGPGLHACERRFCCTAPTRSSNPTRSRARSITSSSPARCARSVSRTTLRASSTCCASVRQPIVANQLQLSIVHAPIIANRSGLAQAITEDGGGIVDYCRVNDITIQAWSPVQSGADAGVFLGSEAYPELNAVIDRLAAQYDVPPIAIATAWITRHPAGMQVVLGTTTPERVTAAAQGSDLALTRPEWYELFRAAGHRVP